MVAYLLRRLLLIIPTLFGIIAINFVVVQFAPGGPVEQMIAELQGPRRRRHRAHDRRRRGETTAPPAATARYRGARGLDPHMVADIQQDVRLRQAAARAVRA